MTANSAQHPGPSRLLGWGLLAALLLFCAIPKASTIVFTWPWVFYFQALLLAPAFLLTLAYWRRQPAPRVPTGAALLLALAIGVSVFYSRQPHFSFEAALPLWSGLAWTLWLAATLRERCDNALGFHRFARLVGVLMLVPLLVSAVLYAGELTDAMRAAGTWRIELTYHRNWFPLGHWNYTGGLALLTLPWLFVLARSDRGGWRALWFFGLAVDAAVFVSASSRGAVLGAALSLVFVGSLWLLRHRLSRRQFLAALGAGVLLLAGLLATNPRLLELARHPTRALQPNDGDVQRIGMAQAGWLLGRQRPMLGHGPGMVSFVYPEVRAQVIGGVETSYQLHNGPLHLWVTTGAIGFAAALGLLALVAVSLRRWWTQPDSEPRSLALASGCTLVAYGGLFLTDYQLDVLAIVALVGLHAGLVLSARPAVANVETVALPVRPWRLIAPIPALAGLAALAVLVPHWRAHQLYWDALATTPAAERIPLAQRILGAAEVAPWNSHYYAAAGFQLALASTGRDDPKLRELARNVLGQSLALDPAQEPVHATLGWLWLPDDPAPARRHFETARHLLPDRPSNNFGLALACLGENDTAAAVHALALELLVNPFFVCSPYWRQPPLMEYREAAYARWELLMAEAIDDPRLPAWRRPALLQARAVVRWWHAGVPPSAEALAAATPEQRAVLTLLAGARLSSVELPQPWRALQAALEHPAEADALLTPVLGDNAPALANALDRLATHPASLPALLRAPASPHATLARNTVERGHYSLMHRNLDGPGYADLTPYLDDPFLLRFVGPLFPPRGYVPSLILEDLATARQSTIPAG
jgi:O-antigen ligase